MNPALTQPVAQMNIGVLRHPLDDPRTAGFAENSDRVNAVAERSAGFVWRCVDEAATLAAEGIRLHDGDPNAICAMSVWESAEGLAQLARLNVEGPDADACDFAWLRAQHGGLQ